jgi:putative PEP-CTERM system histidine kinase
MNLVGAFSHALAALVYVGLALLLLVGWRGRVTGLRLVGAVAATAVWAGTIAAAYRFGAVPPRSVVLAEQLRLASWITALAGLAASGGISGWLVRAAYGLAALALAIAVIIAVFGAGWLHPFTVQGFLLAAGIALPLTGLVLLEQLYRNSDGPGRNALRPLFVGVGAMFVFDVFMYSEATMALSISSEAWAVRGLIAAACAPAIGLAARRNPSWSLDVFVSRHVVFYSTTFLAVGIYLVAMSAGGYLIALYGGRWGELAQFAFFAGAAVVLAILVASDAARTRLRVFLSKHFYRNKYDYRVEWLRFVQALDADGDALKFRPAMIRAAAQIIGSHFGALWIRVEDDQRLIVATQWSDFGERTGRFAALDAGSEFINFLERRQWLVDLVEYRQSPGLYDNLSLPDSLAAPHDLRLFIPLMHGGRLVGLLGLGPPDEPFRMTYEDRDLLKTVGHHIGTHVAQLESDRKLTESRQFEAYSRLTAFLMHDLKNLVAQLSLVVTNAEKHRRNPEFVDDAIDTIRHSTERMTRLIEQLQRRELRTVDRRIRVKELLERVLAPMTTREPRPTLECTAPDVTVIADPERLAISVEHVIRNAQDATPANGAVSVRLAAADGRAVIQVADDGCGMSAEFVNHRLFRPFDSTKGAGGMGIGAYQVRDYVHSIGGEVHVSSAPGAGTIFSISLPVATPMEA